MIPPVGEVVPGATNPVAPENVQMEIVAAIPVEAADTVAAADVVARPVKAVKSVVSAMARGRTPDRKAKFGGRPP
jgi:hypothetical protein